MAILINHGKSRKEECGRLTSFFVPLNNRTNILDNPQLFDNHGRELSYLRLAVTDRCNLRCTYCMPAEGVNYLPERELLSWEEMFRLTRIMHEMGIKKVRITGGEPFVRNGLLDFLTNLAGLKDLEICLTTNGVFLGDYMDDLQKLGVRHINLSLDSLDRVRFKQITRRDDFEKVYENLLRLIQAGFQVKINAVVMQGKNEEDIIALTEFAREHPVSVRFIEEMPFNGSGLVEDTLFWDHIRILDRIKSVFPGLQARPFFYGETAHTYDIPGFQGNVGVIAAFSRTFCGTCNRIRLTAKGQVKTCLYDDGVFDLKAYLRSGVSDEDVKNQLLTLFNKRPLDGFEAENKRKGVITESMTTIGG
jgi:molybdenum cofactor biosynthesis protein A